MATWPAKARMISVAAAILSASPVARAADETASRAALLQQARNLVSVFSEKLKNQLVEAMTAGGPVTAIEVCMIAAPVIAREVSIEGWSVGLEASLCSAATLQRPLTGQTYPRTIWLEPPPRIGRR